MISNSMRLGIYFNKEIFQAKYAGRSDISNNIRDGWYDESFNKIIIPIDWKFLIQKIINK